MSNGLCCTSRLKPAQAARVPYTGKSSSCSRNPPGARAISWQEAEARPHAAQPPASACGLFSHVLQVLVLEKVQIKVVALRHLHRVGQVWHFGGEGPKRGLSWESLGRGLKHAGLGPSSCQQTPLKSHLGTVSQTACNRG